MNARHHFSPLHPDQQPGAVSAGAQSMNHDDDGMGRHAHDSDISSAVKRSLRSRSGCAVSALGVQTEHGAVRLSGYARSAAVRHEAEFMAWQVVGVTSVQNQLVVDR